MDRLSAAAEQALAREFAPEAQPTARELAGRYGVGPQEREVDRVRAALLSLSRGRLDLLGHYLAIAQHDYRDVLYWADHPEQAPKR
ncbi:MAG TPA: hypothetical protein VHR41_01905 [Gemmatimonadales bacterium]|jgi:hypothetical protein|nr:hypothetical protein [Gemmatimonadales bacterium]